jgi:hypothetical protein
MRLSLGLATSDLSDPATEADAIANIGDLADDMQTAALALSNSD